MGLLLEYQIGSEREKGQREKKVYFGLLGVLGITIAIFCVLSIVFIYRWYSEAKALASIRPLFNNTFETHSETGRGGWYQTDVIPVSEGFVAYDSGDNIIVFGKTPAKEILTVPVRQGNGDVISVGPNGSRIAIPIIRDSLIFFDKGGVIHTSPLNGRNAKDVYKLFEKDPHLDVKALCSQLDSNSLILP